MAGLHHMLEELSVPRLAFYAVNVLRESPEHPDMRGFFDELDGILASARATDGCVSVVVGSAAPALPQVEGVSYPLTTLSVWEDAESALAFTFHFTGRHGVVMRRRNEWLVPFTGPMYAAWWIGAHDIPTWDEAIARIEHLRANGPSPYAFNFSAPFTHDGQVLRLDQARINARRQSVH
jgi:hypothetical protein